MSDKKPLPFFVPRAELKDVVGVSWSSVHINNMVRRGTFPAPYKVSENRIAWLFDDLVKWKESRQQVPNQKHRTRVLPDPDERNARAADRYARKQEGMK